MHLYSSALSRVSEIYSAAWHARLPKIGHTNKAFKFHETLLKKVSFLGTCAVYEGNPSEFEPVLKNKTHSSSEMVPTVSYVVTAGIVIISKN